MPKRHIAAEFYVKTLCGRFVRADSDARWVATARDHRGVCRGCENAEIKREHARLLEELENYDRVAEKVAELWRYGQGPARSKLPAPIETYEQAGLERVANNHEEEL